MQDLILAYLADSLAVKERFIRSHLDLIVKGAERIAACLASGHKLLLFGNGGSAADAQHIAAEFVNRFHVERPPLAAIALTTDSSVITSISNDHHFDEIFARQIRALARSDDIALAISTSGNSPNVVKGLRAARELDLYTIGLTGRGGQLTHMVDLLYAVASDHTARIQEAHITLGHMLCELTDRILFADGT